MGKECFRVYTHLDIAEADRKKVDKILQALERHFEPTRNVIYERYKFNTCEQDQGETVAQYITKLRQLASTCEFGVLENGANPKAKKETETIACKYCGGKHKKGKQLCPAYGEIVPTAS